MAALAAIFLQLLFIAVVLYGAYWAVRIAVRHAIADSGMVSLLRSAVETDDYGEDDDEESTEDSDDDEDVRR